MLAHAGAFPLRAGTGVPCLAGITRPRDQVERCCLMTLVGVLGHDAVDARSTPERGETPKAAMARQEILLPDASPAARLGRVRRRSRSRSSAETAACRRIRACPGLPWPMTTPRRGSRIMRPTAATTAAMPAIAMKKGRQSAAVICWQHDIPGNTPLGSFAR